MKPSSDSGRFGRPINYDFTSAEDIFISPQDQDRVRKDIVDVSKPYTNHFFDIDPSSRISADPQSVHRLKKENTRAKPLNGEIYSQSYTSYVNISSRKRRRCPVHIYEDKIYHLPENPIEFIHGSSKIKIHMDHNFKSGQCISLNNIISKNLILHGVISIKKNSWYARINCPAHGLSLYGVHDDFIPVSLVEDFEMGPNEIPDFRQYYILANNPLIITLNGVTNIKNLNLPHPACLLYTKTPTGFQLVRDAYVIKLNRKFQFNYKDDQQIYLKHEDLFGVPLPNLNIPVTILSTTDCMFIVDIGCCAIVDPYLNETCGGGSQAYVRLIRESLPAYPCTHTYVINLDKTYRNIISAKIVGSVFPNNQNSIRPTKNSIYWRNLDDDHLHSISVNPGDYTADQLKIQLEKAFANTKRDRSCNRRFDVNGLLTYHLMELEIGDQTSISSFKQFAGKSIVSVVYDKIRISEPADLIYWNHQLYVHDGNLIANLEVDRGIIVNIGNCEMQSINTTSILSQFTFNDILQTLYLTHHQLRIGDLIITDLFIPNIAIFEVTSIINENSIRIKKFPGRFSLDSVVSPLLSVETRLKINHSNHQITPHTKIRIGSKTDLSDAKYYQIERIIDDNHYEIFDEDYVAGLDTVVITWPDIFQLCFDQSDTLGDILSFSRCGEKNSITGFAHCIKSTDPYIYGYATPESDPYNYFYICCPELNTGIAYYRNTAPIIDVFGEIRWFYNEYNGISFDSYVPATKIFDPPIDILTELRICLVDPDGLPVDVADHSFVIEFVEVFNQPSLTDISARINSEILPRRV